MKTKKLLSDQEPAPQLLNKAVNSKRGRDVPKPEWNLIKKQTEPLEAPKQASVKKPRPNRDEAAKQKQTDARTYQVANDDFWGHGPKTLPIKPNTKPYSVEYKFPEGMEPKEEEQSPKQAPKGP